MVASDFQLTGWYSDMLFDSRAGLNDPKYLCKGSYLPLTNGPKLDGSGQTCYVNPIAASYRNPTVIWFGNGNGKLDPTAPGFTMYAVALQQGANVTTDYLPSNCTAQGVCRNCSQFDAVRQNWGTGSSSDQTCAVIHSNKLCTATSYYDNSWNVSDCALVASVSSTSGMMMASWKQVGGLASASSSKSAAVAGRTAGVAATMLVGAVMAVIGAIMVL
jgi:hypothetical protein